MAQPDFDDPTYMTSAEFSRSDGSYDPPSKFLDRVPTVKERALSNGQPGTPDETPADGKEDTGSPDAQIEDAEPPVTTEDIEPEVKETEDYSDVEITDESQPSTPLPPGCTNSSSEENEESEEGRGVQRKRTVRQSFERKEEKDDKIYVTGDLVSSRPMLSFKTRQSSKEELEEEGIYQGLVMTDEQKQQLGILPESIYMTAALETWSDELEHMSMEMHRREVRPASSQSKPASVTPKYRGCILYPPPLPPLSPEASTTQRKTHAVVENLLKSEAAFLTSLNIATKIYMQPLLDMSSPPIDKEQVQTLFGPISEIMTHHELFYTALTSRTMEWGPKQTIGNIFMTFYRKEVIDHYVAYVNNFTSAMKILQDSIKKRAKFVTFLKERFKDSKTSLSLQGLLLKPVQRFPQYILFLQDLIKYTSPHHPDRVTLQLALARYETIAEYLNAAKRTKEQWSIVDHLSTKVSDLPFRLKDSPNRWLHRQDVVQRLLFSPPGSDSVVQLKRCLLLFNNMIMCASLRKSPKGHDLVSSSGSRDFKSNEDAYYKSKWHCPLDMLQVVEPDFLNDIWEHLVKEDNSEEATLYHELKSQFTSVAQDFEIMTRISSLVSRLNSDFMGLTTNAIQNNLRVLQRKLAIAKDQLRSHMPGRLDIQIPSRDGTTTVHHTYVFESEKAKQNWLNTLRYAKLKMKDENKDAWVYAENIEDDDYVLDSTGNLPLFVDHYWLTNTSESLTTECATKVCSNQVWFASCSGSTAEIAIIQCVTPRPLILKSFRVDCSRIFSICYAPGKGSHQNQYSPGSTSTSTSTMLTSLSLTSAMDTVWMGSQRGKLMIHCASSEVAHKCVQIINFDDAITCLEYWKNQVFVATTGAIYVYRRPKGSSWDLDNPVVFRVHESAAITCLCRVKQWLWIGVKNLCYVLNMVSLKMEGHFEMCKEPDKVRKMTSSGSGVWVSFRRSATIQLFHTVTKALLQQIDIKSAFIRIVSKHNLEKKLPDISSLHITSLLVCRGYLWVGTSTGATLVYRTPYLETVPIVTGKPYLATDAHRSAVRVLLTTHTMATLTSSRLSQFISDEQERYQEDWEITETFDDSFMSATTTGSLASNGASIQRRPQSTSDAPPAILEEQSSTPSPLPSPNFTDSQSPDGTLQRNGLPKSQPEAAPTADPYGDSSTLTGHEKSVTQPPDDSKMSPPKPPRKRILAENELTEAGDITGTTPEATNTSDASGDTSTLPATNGISPELPRAGVQSSEVKSQAEGNDGQESEDDLKTFRRVPTPEAEASMCYEADKERHRRSKSPSPYEEPAPLDLTGPIPVNTMTSFTTPDHMTLTGRPAQPLEGAIYVLTGGRGLVNLRQGRRRSMYSMALSGTGAADESCIIAYELKRGYM